MWGFQETLACVSCVLSWFQDISISCSCPFLCRDWLDHHKTCVFVVFSLVNKVPFRTSQWHFFGCDWIAAQGARGKIDAVRIHQPVTGKLTRSLFGNQWIGLAKFLTAKLGNYFFLTHMAHGFSCKCFPFWPKSGSKPIILAFSLIINSPTWHVWYLLGGSPYTKHDLKQSVGYGHLNCTLVVTWLMLREKLPETMVEQWFLTPRYKGVMMCHVICPINSESRCMERKNIVSRFEANLRPWLVSELLSALKSVSPWK